MGITDLTDTLRDKIAAVLAGHHTDCDGSFLQCECDARWRSIHAWADHAADALVAELGTIPDRTHIDDKGRLWEWCGGEPGTWAWRITNLGKQ